VGVHAEGLQLAGSTYWEHYCLARKPFYGGTTVVGRGGDAA
jgi:hypothetical protein